MVATRSSARSQGVNLSKGLPIPRRNPRKLSNWPKLPVELKKIVIEKLKYDDRQSLRQCAKQELAIVDQTPIHIPVAVFGGDAVSGVRHRFYELQRYEMYYRIGNNPPDLKKFLMERSENEEKYAVDQFLRIFNCQKSSVKEIQFRFTENNTHMKVLKELIAETQSRGIKIRASKLHLSCPNNTPTALLISLVKLFDEKVLESIWIYKLNQRIFDEIVKTEQWKICKRYDLSDLSTTGANFLLHSFDFDTQNLSNADTLELWLQKIDSQRILGLIENFKSKPHGSTFKVFSTNFLDLDPIMKSFKRPFIDERVEDHPNLLFTQRLETVDRDNVLVIDLYYYVVLGAVCRRNNLEIDHAKLEEFG